MRSTLAGPNLNPAASIIAKCGGERVVAQWLGIDRSQVVRFRRPRSVGGQGGLIPAKYQRRLLDAANKAGVELDPLAFFDKPAAVKAARKRPPQEAAA